MPWLGRRTRGSGALVLLLSLLPLGAAVPSSHVPMEPIMDFEVRGDAFVRDGQRVQVISGELHYFRIPRAYWRDRMARMKAMGFNTLQTYVAWNFHEPVKGLSADESPRRLFFFFLTIQRHSD